MHIETLKLFCDLAELKSFSKTGEKNMLSQSAVSQQFAQLELAHKCQLINRKKRPIELTKEGMLFYKAARDMIARYDKFRVELDEFKSSATMKITIATIFSIGMHTLPEYVKIFMVKYPDVNVHIEYIGAAQIYERIMSDEIDIGIVAVPKQDKRMQVFHFNDEPLVLACSPKHHLASQSWINIQNIRYEKFVAFGKDIPTRQWVDQILQKYDIEITPVMEFDNIETIKRAVEINSGVSILPQTAIAQELQSGSIKAIEFSNEKFIRPTGIIVRKNKILNQAGLYFVELLQKKIQEAV